MVKHSKGFDMKDEKIMTMTEVQDYLRITKPTMVKILKEGKLKGKKVGRQWRILRSEVDRYLKDFNNK